MKIESIRLHPFAGIQDKSYAFHKGLNILQGPNEAGKSTLFHAILHSLLTNPNLTTKQVEDTMGAFFPAGGGDVIRVTLRLKGDDDAYLDIAKEWKKGNRNGSATLTLADGTEISNTDEVQKQIEDFLPVSAATLRKVLLAGQSYLQGTIERMKEAEQVRNELGTVLRQGVMETGGVSVDRFRDVLKVSYESYFKRWDKDKQYPDNNRGIQNPYQKDTGKIVEAFYRKEQARLDLEKARKYEKEMEQIDEKLAELTTAYKDKKETYNGYQPLKNDVQERQNIENKKEALNQELEKLKHANKEWPKIESRLQGLPEELEEVDASIQNLQEELKALEKRQAYSDLQKRVNKLQELKKEWDKAQQEVDEATAITDQQVEELQELQNAIQELQAKKDAAQFQVKLTSKKQGLHAKLDEAGREESTTIELNEQEEHHAEPTGAFTLESDALRLEVRTGDRSIEEILQELEAEQKSLNDQLRDFGARNVQDAVSTHKLYKDKCYQRDQNKKNYQQELGEDTLEDLQNQLHNYDLPEEPRPSSEVNDELTNAKSQKQELQKEQKDKQEQIDEWVEKYESHDQLAVELGEKSKEVKDIDKQLGELAQLPDGFEKAEDFINHVEHLEKELEDLSGDISETKQNKIRKEGEAPERSFEEAEAEQQDAEEAFERTKQEGERIERVYNKTVELMNELGADTYQGLEQSFRNWLKQVTKERFDGVDMDDDLPQGFHTSDQKQLSYELLSYGTKGSVALAWRFALCEHFLPSQMGVLTLDDPLVDMDQDRRNAALDALERFAEQHQVLMMTCHPEHVENFDDGSLVNME